MRIHVLLATVEGLFIVIVSLLPGVNAEIAGVELFVLLRTTPLDIVYSTRFLVA